MNIFFFKDHCHHVKLFLSEKNIVVKKVLLGKALRTKFLHFYDGNGSVLFTGILFDLNNPEWIAKGL